jgi:hypothetical protein
VIADEVEAKGPVNIDWLWQTWAEVSAKGNQAV